NQVPVPPHQVAPRVPAAVSEAIMRALAKDPMQRFATADDFLHALKLTPATSQEGATYTAPLPAPAASERTPIPPSATPPPFVPPAASGRSPLPSASATQVAPHKSQSSSGLQSLPLEDIARKLAVYVGPVAKILIKKLAEK